jgi:hypothetical protein
MPIGVLEPVLQGTEKTFAAGDGKNHAAQFAEETLPLANGDPSFSLEVGEKVQQAGGPVRGQRQGLVDCVDDLA